MLAFRQKKGKSQKKKLLVRVLWQYALVHAAFLLVYRLCPQWRYQGFQKSRTHASHFAYIQNAERGRRMEKVLRRSIRD